MRGFNSYFFKDKFHVFSFFSKKRLTNFKRPKWKKVKSQLMYYDRQLKQNKKHTFFTTFKKFKIQLFFIKKKLNILKKKKFLIKLKFLNFFKKLKKYLISRRYKLTCFKQLSNLKKKNNLKFKYRQDFYKEKTQTFIFSFFLFNFLFIKKNEKLKAKSRYIFKNTLFMKYNIIKYFFGLISLKSFKKYLFKSFKFQNRKDILSHLLLQSEYRVDILLWRLKFFSSPYFARFACQKGFISLNKYSKNVNTNFLFKKFLYSGDILSINLKYSFRKNLNSYCQTLYLPYIFEIDYYTSQVVILKNLKDLNFKDINSVLKQPLCFYKFKDYLINN